MKWYGWASIGFGLLLAGGAFNRQRVMNDLRKIRLGEFFTLDEFVKTITGFEDAPPQEVIDSLTALVKNCLDPIRRAIGKPIKVTSGYRSPEKNASIFVDANNNGVRDAGEVGSSKTSQHMKGEAADIQIQGMTNQQIIDLIRKLRLPYDQLIDEQQGSSLWVHISHRKVGAQRTQWLTRRDPGEYKTIKYGYA